MKFKSIPSLTKAEEEIMHIIWKLDKCLVREIIKQLGNLDIPHSTVSSVVRILERKGFITHKAYGKTYEYSALVSKEDYTQEHVKGLLKNYFSNSPKNLVSFLINQNNLNIQELNSLLLGLHKTPKK